MKSTLQKLLSFFAIAMFAVLTGFLIFSGNPESVVLGQQETNAPTPEPTPVFDQEAAIAKLKEEIKGREDEPASKVFKNLKYFGEMPAGRILSIMQFGYARSLGVSCNHCHAPENWASDEKQQKMTARDMHAMVSKINGEILPGIKAFEGREGRAAPVVNCTTCHRGEVKPETNLGR